MFSLFWRGFDCDSCASISICFSAEKHSFFRTIFYILKLRLIQRRQSKNNSCCVNNRSSPWKKSEIPISTTFNNKNRQIRTLAWIRYKCRLSNETRVVFTVRLRSRPRSTPQCLLSAENIPLLTVARHAPASWCFLAMTLKFYLVWCVETRDGLLHGNCRLLSAGRLAWNQYTITISEVG